MFYPSRHANARLAPFAHVEDEARIARGFAPEAGRRDVMLPQEFFDAA